MHQGRPEARPAAVGLLGCGVMAGLGAAINTGAVTRGKSVAVIGCGGVGVAAIAGSALAGASPIIAVDIDAKKLEAAKRMGATHTVDSSALDPVAAIKEICAQANQGAEGADVVVEAVGRPETWKQAFYARDLAGTVVLVGVPTPDMKLPDLPLVDVFGRGGALKSSLVRRLPALARLPDAGRPLPAGPARPGRVRHRGDQARTRWRPPSSEMHHGDVLRSVVISVTARVDHGVTSGTSEWLTPLDIGESRRRSCDELDRGFRFRVDSGGR